jgi:hypothetical protein
MKRILLFLATNLAVVLVLSVVMNVLGVGRFLTGSGLNFNALFVFSLVIGFAGSIISLLISRPMAKWATGARVIDSPRDSTEQWLVDTVRELARRARIDMPEVAIFEGAPNAFATGAFKNSALVAVSTGLLQSMNREEVEAVLGHEISHVSNGDMVTTVVKKTADERHVVDDRRCGQGTRFTQTRHVCLHAALSRRQSGRRYPPCGSQLLLAKKVNEVSKRGLIPSAGPNMPSAIS